MERERERELLEGLDDDDEEVGSEEKRGRASDAEESSGWC